MKDERMIILLYYLVLLTTSFTATTEIGSVVTPVINEEITDASSEFTASDGSTNNSRNWSPYDEFKSSPNEFPQNHFVETQSNSSVLEKLESSSCEVEATRFGYENTLQVILHEIFCELNKLLHYVLIAIQNLKSEFHVVILYSLTHDAISLSEPVLNGVLSDIVGRRIVRLEEFLENAKNVETLLDSIRKCVPISNIQTTMNRFNIAVKKLLSHIQEIFAYLEFYNNDEIVKEVKEKIFIAKDEIINLFYGYLSDNLRDTTDLVLTTISWIELVFENLKIYVQEKLYLYLIALEEITNIVYIFYDGFCASELSKTITYLIFSTNESYELFSSSTTTAPSSEDILKGLTLDRPQNFALTSTEDNQMLSDPIDSSRSTSDKNLPPDNYDQSKYVSLRSTSASFIDISKTSEDDLENYTSGLSYFPPTTMPSVNNILQSLDMNVKVEDNTPLPLPPMFPTDKILLEKPFPYTSQPETSPVTDSTSDTFLHEMSNVQSDTNVPSFPIALSFLTKQIAETDFWSYTTPSGPSTASQMPDSLPSLPIFKMINPIINQNYNESSNSFIPTSSLIPDGSSNNLKSYVDHSKSADSFFKVLYTYPEYKNP